MRLTGTWDVPRLHNIEVWNAGASEPGNRGLEHGTGFLLGKMSWAREHRVELKLSPDSYVANFRDSDVVHDIITILGTLLNNAIEAVEKSDTKVVTVLLQQDAGRMHIEVTDTGPGIPPELCARIFADGYSTKGENRGIGLYMVQRLLLRQ